MDGLTVRHRQPSARVLSSGSRRDTGGSQGTRWYVPGALGEENAISDRPPPDTRRARLRGCVAGGFAALALTLAACGGDEQRQDADEPSGDFPVAVTSAKFPTDQRLAQTSDLRLVVENTGSDQLPNLAVTVWTGDDKGGGSFNVASDQPGLANPNRPVWILENGFPKVATSSDESVKDLDAAPTAGADVAQTDTFAFGPLAAGDSKDIVWRVTPVDAGTYTLHYELAAGLNGKAKAVGDDGSPVEGEFVVTINDKPQRATVDATGNVELEGN